MKQIIILTTVFLIAAVLSVAAQSKNKNTEQEFLRLHRAEEEAESKRDIVALDRLLNDDFIFVAANGRVSDKKKFLDEIKGDSEPSSAPQPNLSYEDFKARVYGKTAIVNYVLLVSGKDEAGKDYANRYRMSVVWVKQKGHWRISNFHATRVRA
ncbi:MAG: nuclear transport factor 2 family protein [Acidobacteriota bacterium]